MSVSSTGTPVAGNQQGQGAEAVKSKGKDWSAFYDRCSIAMLLALMVGGVALIGGSAYCLYTGKGIEVLGKSLTGDSTEGTYACIIAMLVGSYVVKKSFSEIRKIRNEANMPAQPQRAAAQVEQPIQRAAEQPDQRATAPRGVLTREGFPSRPNRRCTPPNKEQFSRGPSLADREIQGVKDALIYNAGARPMFDISYNRSSTH